MTSAPTFSDYMAMFRRRRKSFLIVFAMLFGASVTLATMLPSVYEATATIQIEKHEVPGNLMESTVVLGYIDEHLDALGRSVLSTENLWQVAEDLDLYPDIRNESAKDEVVSMIRKNAGREILYVDIGPDDQRRGESVAVAFTTSYAAADPDTARDVANALAELYISESRRVRAERAAGFADFLRTQTQLLSQRVAEYEQKLADFKEQHGSNLPEFAEHHLRARETTQGQLDRANERINSLNQQKIALQAQLSQVEPRLETNIMAADPQTLSLPQQVERLRLDYLRLSGIYSPRHPDLRRLRNDLQALAGGAPRASEILELVTAIEEERAELTAARERYSDNHPDIVRLQRIVREHREQLRTLGQGDGTSVMADNPAYIAASSRLQAVEADLEAEMQQRETLSRRLTEIENRLLGSPAIEQSYRALTRNYENAVQEYEETRDKLLRAESAERIEEVQLGGSQLKLTSPASRPDEPARPQRAGITVLGFILAAGMGTGLAAIAEYFDRTVRGARGVMTLWGAPPVAAIPVIMTTSEKRMRIIRLAFGWALILALIAGLAFVGFAYSSGIS